MNEFAKESGHWYDRAGNPQYTIVGANGKERNTTLRDSRKHGWLPSVTTILKVMDKPGLNRWKLNQVMTAALTLPKIEGESLSDFEARAWEDSEEHSKNARERGSEIHGAVENYFLTGDINPEFSAEIEAVRDTLKDQWGGVKWKAEKSVFSEKGYGGKIDLMSSNVVVDYKTKDFSASNLPKPFDEQAMQLAAYRECINPCATCANLYISRDNPGVVHLHIWDEKELARGWDMFFHLLRFWQVSKKYNSSF